MMENFTCFALKWYLNWLCKINLYMRLKLSSPFWIMLQDNVLHTRHYTLSSTSNCCKHLTAHSCPWRTFRKATFSFTTFTSSSYSSSFQMRNFLIMLLQLMKIIEVNIHFSWSKEARKPVSCLTGTSYIFYSILNIFIPIISKFASESLSYYHGYQVYMQIKLSVQNSVLNTNV